MEENAGYEDCKTWEEGMYWKHFNSMHFCITLPSDFHDHLKLPEKFAAHMKLQLPNKVSLKGPSGAVWEIELLKSNSNDISFVGNEWKGFVKANELKENCFLVFKYMLKSSFEVLIFDQGSSCEKESAYFVKKCLHTESDNEDKKKRTEREEDFSTEEDSACVATKKSRVPTSTPSEHVRNVAAKSRGRPRKVVPPPKSPNKPEVLSRKNPVRIAPANEASQISQGDMITPENGELSPEDGHASEIDSRSKKSKEANQNSRELTTPQKGNVSPAEDHSPIKKGQSVPKKPQGNDTTNVSRDNNLTEYGENFQHMDVSQKLEAKRTRKDDTSKEPSQITETGLNTPEKGDYVRVTVCTQAEKEPSGRSSAKMIRPDYRESSSEEDRPFRSRGKRGRGSGRGRPKMQVLPESSKKLEFNSVSEKKRVPVEYMSNRRPVTEMEKDRAFERACQNETEDSFTVIMKPSSVYKRFFMSVPTSWLQKHLPSRNQEVILRVGDKTWRTSLFNYGTKSAGFSTGWKKFALENWLEEFDVLVFKVAGQEDDAEAIMMDVEIFRVVEKIVPVLPMISHAK